MKQLERLSENKKKKARVVPAGHIEQIQDYGLAMNMSGIVVDRAQEIYKEFVESGRTIQRTKVSSYLQVASLYIAARQLGQMKMMKEMALVTDVKQSDIRKGDIKIRSLAPSALVRDFNVHINAAGDADADTDADGEEMALLIPDLETGPYVKAAVDRLCNALKFEFRQRKCAVEMENVVVKKGLVSMQAPSVAAAIVWTCSRLFERNDDINLNIQHSVGKTTIRRAYNRLKPHLTSLISTDIFGDPQDWKKKLKQP